MTTTLIVREDVNLDTILRDVESMQKMCTSLMKTKHYQTMGEAGIFAIVQKAKSLNINPLEALNGGLYYVQGKVGMSSEMMSSLIRQSGHSIVKDSKSDNTVCILHGKRSDNGDTWTITFSMEDAKRAGLAKNMYDKYPSIMLYNRAMSMLARQLFPDVIKGAAYTQEELKEISDKPMQIVQNENPPEFITETQVDDLLEILDSCDAEYQRQVIAFIKKPPVNAETLYQLPVALYERLRTAAIKKRDEAKASKSSQEIETNVMEA